jgi:hypothetical protein
MVRGVRSRSTNISGGHENVGGVDHLLAEMFMTPPAGRHAPAGTCTHDGRHPVGDRAKSPVEVTSRSRGATGTGGLEALDVGLDGRAPAAGALDQSLIFAGCAGRPPWRREIVLEVQVVNRVEDALSRTHPPPLVSKRPLRRAAAVSLVTLVVSSLRRRAPTHQRARWS